MRHIAVILILATVALSGCGGGHGTAQPAPVVGVMDRSQLPPSFKAVYDTVVIQQDVVDLLKLAAGGVETKVFLGTWCSDSRREVPRFLKTTDALGKILGPVTLIGLDTHKKSPAGLEVSYAIERVPTFIFFRNGQEIGRIVELPMTTVEADMLTIVAKGVTQ
jgi:thiol-disulfide isomerase/thioredoxin